MKNKIETLIVFYQAQVNELQLSMENTNSQIAYNSREGAMLTLQDVIRDLKSLL